MRQLLHRESGSTPRILTILHCRSEMPHYLQSVIDMYNLQFFCCTSQRHNIGTFRMIVKLERKLRVFDCSLAFKSVSPAFDFLLALLEYIIHFFIAMILIVVKEKQLFHIGLCRDTKGE